MQALQSFPRQKLLDACGTRALADDPLASVVEWQDLYRAEIQELAKDSRVQTFGEFFRALSSNETVACYAGARMCRDLIGTHRHETVESLRIPVRGMRLVQGDLVVAREIENAGLLIVLGNLVAGHYSDTDLSSDLIVLGNATVEWTDVSGGVALGGNLDVRDALYGRDQHEEFSVGGLVRTRLLLLDNKTLDAGAVEAVVRYDPRRPRAQSLHELETILVPEVLRVLREVEDGQLPVRVEELMRRLATGAPIFLS